MTGIQLFSKRKHVPVSETSEVQTLQNEKKEELEDTSDVVKTFEDLGCDQWIQETLSSLSISEPTQVQRRCIPAIFNNRDIIASAKTGSGKTAAFALPMLQVLSRDPFGVFAVVLTPTRELAIQIFEQFKVFGKPINLKISLVVGGLDMMKQAAEIRERPHIIVATPGRLADVVKSCSDTVFFSKVRFLVLDEADRLLEKCFRPDIQDILRLLPSKRQNLLFSATLSRNLEDVKFLGMNNPAVFHANEEFGTVEKIVQNFILVPAKVRDVYLAWLLLNDFKDKTVIIFTGKCKTCEVLRLTLRALSIRVTALHSQLTQNDRIGSLAKFKSNIVPILLSTDVGSRGLDIPSVQVVINFDVPCDAKDYVHRIGRTARAGRGGLALTFVTEYDVDLVQNIEGKTGKMMEEYPLAEDKVLEMLNKVSDARKEALITLEDKEFDLKLKKRKQLKTE